MKNQNESNFITIYDTTINRQHISSIYNEEGSLIIEMLNGREHIFLCRSKDEILHYINKLTGIK